MGAVVNSKDPMLIMEYMEHGSLLEVLQNPTIELESDDIAHPAIEALFTIDEETGMTGAQALQPGQLTGDIMLNLDTEEETELTIGCAGGIDVTSTMTVPMVEATAGNGLEIRVRGLTGGHPVIRSAGSEYSG